MPENEGLGARPRVVDPPTAAPGDNGRRVDPPLTGPAGPAEAIHASQDAIALLEADLTIVAWNAAAERMCGIPASDAIGTNLAEWIGITQPGHPDVVGQVVRPSLARTGFWSGRVVEHVLRGPMSGTELIVDTTAIIVHDPGQPAPRMLVTNRDVTASARLEAEMTALASLVAATGHARTETEVAHAALEILCRATEADAGLVISSRDGFQAVARRNVEPVVVERILSLAGPGEPAAAALQQLGGFVSASVASAPIRDEVRAVLLADGLHHLILVGLRVSGQLTGAIALGWRRPLRAEPSTTVVLQAAALVAAALENARLIAAVEHGLDEERLLTRRMRALVELTRLPGAGPPDDRTLDGLLADVDAVIGSAGSLYAEIDGDRLRPIAAANMDLDRIGPMMDAPLSSLPLAEQLIQGRVSILLPIDEESATVAGQAEARDRGFQSVAAFPIRDDERPVGLVFSLFHERVDELELDERTLDAIGRVLDISFTNRRLRAGAVASEHRYRELFEGSPEALVVQSMDRIVIDANPAARQLYGDDLIGHSVDELVDDDEDTTVLDDQGVAHYTGTGHRLDGSTFPEEVDVRWIELDGQQRMLAIVRDLTERSRLQAELIQAQKMEAIGLLVAGVAHELNNPLASIVAFSQLLRSDVSLPHDLRAQADLLVQEANRTRTIVGNLLDFARQRPPERVETDLRQLVEGILGLQSYMLMRDRLTVEVDIPDDLPLLSVDRSQFQQVLVNLTVNAAQAIHETGRAGHISISASSHRGEPGTIVRIAIADDGPGVPPAIVDRLFVPFVSSKPPGAGTGLGLSVSFGIVAAHGGTIHHEPNAAGGATFVIELPIGADPTRDARRGPTDDASDATALARVFDGTRAAGRVTAADGQHADAGAGAGPRRRAVDPGVPRPRPRPVGLRARAGRDGQGRARDRPHGSAGGDLVRPPDGGHERDGVPGRRRLDRSRAGATVRLHERRRPEPRAARLRDRARSPPAREAVRHRDDRRDGPGAARGPGRLTDSRLRGAGRRRSRGRSSVRGARPGRGSGGWPAARTGRDRTPRRGPP